MLALISLIAQVLPIEIINLLAPLVVWAAVQAFKWALPKVPGWAILSVVVPVLSALAAWIATLIAPESSFVLQVVLGLLSVFVAELVRQFGQGNNKL